MFIVSQVINHACHFSLAQQFFNNGHVTVFSWNVHIYLHSQQLFNTCCDPFSHW